MSKTKQQITAKAMELFREHPYPEVSVEQICRECGISTGAFYYYFKSKRDVILDYVYTSLDLNDGILLKVLAEPSRFEQAWLMYEDRNSHRVAMGADTLRELWISKLEAGGDAADPMNDHWAGAHESTEMVLKIIRLGQRSGEIRSDRTAEELHSTFLYTKTAMLIDWATSGGSFDVMARMRTAFESTFSPVKEVMPVENQ